MMGRIPRRSVVIAVCVLALVAGRASAESSGRDDYMHDCAECHGVDGKGEQQWKRAVRGYVSIDLTHITRRNGAEFPRQKVYDAIDGRSRIAVHFRGDMPRWGARYRVDENNQAVAEKTVRDRISGLVDFIESMQEK